MKKNSFVFMSSPYEVPLDILYLDFVMKHYCKKKLHVKIYPINKVEFFDKSGHKSAKMKKTNMHLEQLTF